MTKSYLQLTRKIEALKVEASKLRSAEVKGVIARINQAIAFYGIRPADLRFGKPNGALNRHGASKAGYSDGKGNTWSGRGRRPQWLKEAMDAGATLTDFRPSTRSTSVAKASTAIAPRGSTRTGKTTRRTVAPKYRNAETGDTWTGRGSKPVWLRQALDSGRSLDDFLIRD